MMTAMDGAQKQGRQRTGLGMLLLIDTCGTDGSIALAALGETARVLRSATMPGRSSSERLLPELRGMLAAEEMAVADVRAIAVVRGPGSFTGIRVGVAAAKGLAEALGVPVIGLSRLAVLASLVQRGEVEAGSGNGGAVGEAREIAALLAAGRGEVYCGRFRADGGAALWEALLTRAAAAERCAGARVVCCEPMVKDALPELEVELMDLSGAGAALGLALDHLRKGSFDGASVLDGYYLRRTPAEMALESGGAAEKVAAGS